MGRRWTVEIALLMLGSVALLGCGEGSGRGGGGAQLCSNTCEYANDGECDDGHPDADYLVCAYGTDCNDCGPRPANVTCTNTCDFADDGDCDDGGPNSDFSLCALGTDCFDCGPRPLP